MNSSRPVTTCMTFIGSAKDPALRRDVYILSLLCFSLVITSLGTVFIIMRISSVTRQGPSLPNPAPYKRVQRILIDSGFIYSLCMFITVILLPFMINSSTGTSSVIPSLIATYSQALLTPLAVRFRLMLQKNWVFLCSLYQGIAPTLIALRVVRELPETEVDGTQRMSHLTFKRDSPRSWTFDITNLFSSIRSGCTSSSGTQHFSTAHSHLTEVNGDTNGGHGDGEECRDRDLERLGDQGAA